MKRVITNATIALLLTSALTCAYAKVVTVETGQPDTPYQPGNQSEAYLLAANTTPQLRTDSDAHWEKLEYDLPSADQIRAIHNAAEQGDAEAQFRLAMMYDDGHGVEQDSAEAVKWFYKAAEQGQVEAQYNLAVMLDAGSGVEQDHTKAARWYLAAAERGYTSAQKNLAVKYGLGQGVPQSDIEAYIWSAIAAQTGDEGAVNNRNLAASKLSPEELEAAQKWAAKRYQVILQKQPPQQKLLG